MGLWRGQSLPGVPRDPGQDWRMLHSFRDCNNAGARSAVVESQAEQECVRLVPNLALWNRILPAFLAEVRVGHSAA